MRQVKETRRSSLPAGNGRKKITFCRDTHLLPRRPSPPRRFGNRRRQWRPPGIRLRVPRGLCSAGDRRSGTRDPACRYKFAFRRRSATHQYPGSSASPDAAARLLAAPKARQGFPIRPCGAWRFWPAAGSDGGGNRRKVPKISDFCRFPLASYGYNAHESLMACALERLPTPATAKGVAQPWHRTERPQRSR